MSERAPVRGGLWSVHLVCVKKVCHADTSALSASSMEEFGLIGSCLDRLLVSWESFSEVRASRAEASSYAELFASRLTKGLGKAIDPKLSLGFSRRFEFVAFALPV